MSDKSARLQALLIDPFGGCTAYLRSSRAFREPRPAMGVVKLPEKVAARFSFLMRRQSREVLG
jgi:hypothetical protein